MEANTTTTEALANLCHVSSSQEKYLLHCPFAFENVGNGEGDDDPVSEDEIHVESTGIVMVSPPETPETSQNDDGVSPNDDDDDSNNNNEDAFHTPPEERSPSSSQQTRCGTARVEDQSKAAELTETIEVESDSDDGEVIVSCSVVKSRVLKRGLGLIDGIRESPSKVCKLSKEGLDVEAKGVEILESPFDEECCGSQDAVEERLVKKGNYNSGGISERVGAAKRTLPAWKRGTEGSVVDEEVSHGDRAAVAGDLDEEKDEEVTLLDVLKVLAERCEPDPCIEGLSLYEIAKRRGITFS